MQLTCAPLPESSYDGDRISLSHIHLSSIRPAFNHIYAQAIVLDERHARAQEISASFAKASQRGEKPNQTSHPSEFNFAILQDTRDIEQVEQKYVASLFTLTERYRLLFSRFGASDGDLKQTTYQDCMLLMIPEAKSVLANAKTIIPDIPPFHKPGRLTREQEKQDPLGLSLVWAFQDAMDGKVDMLSHYLTVLTYQATKAEYLCRTPNQDMADVYRFSKSVKDAINWVGTDIERTEKLHDSFVRFIKMRTVQGKSVDVNYH